MPVWLFPKPIHEINHLLPGASGANVACMYQNIAIRKRKEGVLAMGIRYYD
jgi:hypothetical protein